MSIAHRPTTITSDDHNEEPTVRPTAGTSRES